MLDTSKIPVERIEGYNNHITNCITKIPQDIKLELSDDGTLTLKAGSKIYKGNGTSIIIESDVIFHSGNISNVTDTFIIFCDSNGQFGARFPITNNYMISSSSNPGNDYYVWYDTNNKIVKYSPNADGNFTNELSLPIGIYQRDNGIATSIKQIFNGFSYIGNTIFVLPGVEGLISNGFNEDGSLNNILCTINDVKIANTIAGWNNHWYLHLLNENSIAYHPYELYFNQTSSPISMGQTSYWYNPNENMIYYTDDFGITWNSNRKITPFLDIIQDQEKIISITPKLVYQNNTKNDFNKKFQVVSELPTTPEVGVFYFVKE